MLELNDDNTLDTVKTGNFLLMFYRDWCPRCPPIIELLAKLEQTKQGKFQFATIEFFANSRTVERYGVFSIPTVLAIKDGVALKGWCGLDDSEVYNQFIDENM